eukprot:10603141-Alexandrium_andersonii.AAC.1
MGGPPPLCRAEPRPARAVPRRRPPGPALAGRVGRRLPQTPGRALTWIRRAKARGRAVRLLVCVARAQPYSVGGGSVHGHAACHIAPGEGGRPPAASRAGTTAGS